MKKILFPHTTWFLWLLIPVTLAGFYPSYFSKIFDGLPSVFHVHALFMMAWILLAIAQPALIRLKKTRWHRRLGRASYFIMPLVFLTSYLMIRHTYYRRLEELGAGATGAGQPPSPGEVQVLAAENIAIGIVYLGWLILFYLMAVVNRKKLLFHATYMFGAILTLLGPTVDRILFQIWTRFGWPFNFWAENLVFMFNLLLLSSLLWYHWRKKQSLKPAAVALGLYVAGVLLYHLLPGTRGWGAFVEMIF